MIFQETKEEFAELIKYAKENKKEATINLICGILLIAFSLSIAICMFAM